MQMPHDDTIMRRVVVDLREYFEMRVTSVDEKGMMRVEALAKELAVAMHANAIAIDKAEAAVNERLKGMNEFRETLTEQASTFARITAVDAFETQVYEKIEAMREGLRSEISGLRETVNAKLDGQLAASAARAISAKAERDAEFKSIWKFMYGLGISLATLQAVVTIMQNATPALK